MIKKEIQNEKYTIKQMVLIYIFLFKTSCQYKKNKMIVFWKPCHFKYKKYLYFKLNNCHTEKKVIMEWYLFAWMT